MTDTAHAFLPAQEDHALVSPETARCTREQTGLPVTGFSFQPLWDDMVRTDFDLSA
ncbi:hypothetical protein ABZ208_10260 [Streptomyces sp. NPDC006208]|uniref:hypothetical protein n=1 Tax=Streptomyces sp. NPDC006208 TaxID=3156734 RepID=UPI0033AB0783